MTIKNDQKNINKNYKNNDKTFGKNITIILESAAIGISDSISLVANIAANLIGFVALQYFLDAILGWLGHCVGHGTWSFDLLLSYIFYPFVLVMGVDIV